MMPKSAKALASTAASLAASAMVLRTVTRDMIPSEVKAYSMKYIRRFFKSFSSDITMIIEEHEGLASNKLYKAAEIYLATILSPAMELYRISLPDKEKKISVMTAKNQEIVDIFDGVKLKWRQVTSTSRKADHRHGGQSSRTEIRLFMLTFERKFKEKVLDSYFPFILNKAKELEEERKTLKIYTLDSRGSGGWSGLIFDHPATFSTLAMDLDLKKSVIHDLEKFVKRKDYYRRVGKAWKRGYLLYGPPGTGKSSLVAAMANYLQFDVYDLQLTDIHSNSDLRKLLLSTKNRSILVVEDIDCSIEAQVRPSSEAQTSTTTTTSKRTSQVTLSGLLNFIDGLWSSCGDERIIVFTTNHKDRLDPALLRPGRMDMHIHMSYCTPCGFTILASNYLGITDHLVISEIKELMQRIKVTPAEVGEQLLKNEDPEEALQDIVKFLLAKENTTSSND